LHCYSDDECNSGGGNEELVKGIKLEVFGAIYIKLAYLHFDPSNVRSRANVNRLNCGRRVDGIRAFTVPDTGLKFI